MNSTTSIEVSKMPTKAKSAEELEYSYRIYPPGGGHKGFRVFKLYKKLFRNEAVKHQDLEDINNKYISNKINKKTARELVEELREKLYLADGVVSKQPKEASTENLKVLNQYWESEYVPRLRRLEDPDTAWYELERAVRSLGKVSLKSASRNELQKQVDIVAKGNKQRRVVAKLNTLLKYLKRDIELISAKKERKEVKHITLEDLPRLLNHIENEHIKHLTEVCFATGCRIGESFALDGRLHNPGSDTIKIISQIDEDGKKRDTKNNKTRTAVVIPECRAALHSWFHVRPSFPTDLRFGIARIIKRAATKAFPTQPIKHIVFHDLRHSYAIHLLSKGVPLSLVAQCLGDSITVAEEYYVGYDLSEGAIELITRTLRASNESDSKPIKRK
ncbi:MAG: tyrosine-type recombinase/integrase [Candidatus Paceibacterota bacterium]